MKKHIRYQVINGADGAPEYVVVPYDDFLKAVGDNARIPLAVAKRSSLEGVPLARAWREHKGMTQKEVAKKTGITQSALSQMEKPGARPHRGTLVKLAMALGVEVGQLID
jgi:DNA-binding XRE family transcriptional regulator